MGPWDNWRGQQIPYPAPPGMPGAADPSYKPTYPWANPGGTTPAPYPSNMPVGVWLPGGANPLVWTNGTSPVIRQAEWRSPIFDLRPELRTMGDEVNNCVPIWRGSYGAGGHLFVIVENILSTTTALTDLEVLVKELAHPTNPKKCGTEATGMAVVSEVQDVTNYFTGGQTAALLTFTPPGGGYPVRFWRIGILFRFYSAHADPPFTVSAAYY